MLAHTPVCVPKGRLVRQLLQRQVPVQQPLKGLVELLMLDAEDVPRAAQRLLARLAVSVKLLDIEQELLEERVRQRHTRLAEELTAIHLR